MILVVQFHSNRSGPLEVQSIHNSADVSYEEFLFLNARTNGITPFTLQKYALQAEAIIIGGLEEAGYESTSKADKAVLRQVKGIMQPLLKTITENNVPTLAFGFGYQLLADFLGASIIKDPNRAESNVVEITLTDTGAKDSLFQNFNGTFNAVVDYGATIAELPPDTTLLASSDQHAIQVFKYKKNIYACQFHPELNGDNDRAKPSEAGQVINNFIVAY